MNETIWKYYIEITDEQFFTLPVGYKPLAFQLQNGTPVMWVLVRPENPTVRVRFYVFGTGNPTDTPGISKKHVGSIQMGSFVWHLFDGGVAK